MKKVVIVGAGLGGLIAAGLLAKRGMEVKVLERSPIAGGRSHIYKKDGFTMSYGAHAIVLPMADPIKSVLRELGVSVRGKSTSMSKFKLYSEGRLMSAVLGTGALTTPAIVGFGNRLLFFSEFFKMMRTSSAGSDMSVDEWIDQRKLPLSVDTALRAYASLTYYDRALERLRLRDFAQYTSRLYMSPKPLIYTSYEQLLDEFVQVIVNNGGEIEHNSEVMGLVIEDGRAVGVQTKAGIENAEEVILNVPPSALHKLCEHSALVEEIGSVMSQPASYAYVYDIMLSKRMRDDVTNVLDLDQGVYINDYSLNVPSSAPTGKQLLCCLRFLNEHEQADDSHAEHSRQAVENVFDHVYPGWRDHVIQRRIINRAAVNSIARSKDAKLLPLQSRAVQGLYFVGDAVEGFGALGVPAYDSAWRAANLISE